MDIDFNVDINEFLSFLDENSNSKLTELVDELSTDNAKLKSYLNEIVESMHGDLEFNCTSYICYLVGQRDIEQAKPEHFKFLNLEFGTRGDNLLPVAANPASLGNLAEIVNTELSICQEQVDESKRLIEKLQKKTEKVAVEQDLDEVDNSFEIVEDVVTEQILNEEIRDYNVPHSEIGLDVRDSEKDKFKLSSYCDDTFEKVINNETKLLKMKRKLHNSKVLSKFYNMKQREITPQIRKELEVLNLRKYLSKNSFYRGSGKESQLLKNNKGFFEIGVVKSNNNSSDDAMLINNNKKKRSKKHTLIKEILLSHTK